MTDEMIERILRVTSITDETHKLAGILAAQHQLLLALYITWARREGAVRKPNDAIGRAIAGIKPAAADAPSYEMLRKDHSAKYLAGFRKAFLTQEALSPLQTPSSPNPKKADR